MIYIPNDIDLNKYKVCYFHENQILFVDMDTTYLSYSPTLNSFDYIIYDINTAQYSKFSKTYIPSYLFDNLLNRYTAFYSTYSWDTIPHLSYLSQNHYSMYGVRSSQVEFTNNIFYSPKFPEIFICGFINLLIILFIINNLTRIIKKGGILFSS